MPCGRSYSCSTRSSTIHRLDTTKLRSKLRSASPWAATCAVERCCGFRSPGAARVLISPTILESSQMSAPLKNDPYQMPHYGRDGLMLDWLKGWELPEFPNLPPAPVKPANPIVPGLPWWVDPWMPSLPLPLHQKTPSAPDSLPRRAPMEDEGACSCSGTCCSQDGRPRAARPNSNPETARHLLGLVSGRPMQFLSVQPPIHFRY